jgi:hypothetical protein
MRFDLPGGGWARFSTGDFRRNGPDGIGTGPSIEGVGLEPDILVQWHADDLRSGFDADLAAAMAWLGTHDLIHQ